MVSDTNHFYTELLKQACFVDIIFLVDFFVTFALIAWGMHKKNNRMGEESEGLLNLANAFYCQEAESEDPGEDSHPCQSSLK